MHDETVEGCPVCHTPLIHPVEKGACPTCGSRARIRALSPIIRLWRQQGFQPTQPVLAFATPNSEREMLGRIFPSIISVSLYGEYGKNHLSGVDARALKEIGSKSCSGWFASLLFDYFVEHRAALQEAYRVLEPMGKFLTHIAPYRLQDGDSPPTLIGPLKNKPNYLTEEWVGQIPSVSVGRQWFLTAMREVGFDAEHKRILDLNTGEICEWFIGVRVKKSKLIKQTTHISSIGTPTQSKNVVAPPKTIHKQVDPRFGFKEISINLTVPDLPRTTRFVYHVDAPELGSREILGVEKGNIVVSQDLGKTWNFFDVWGQLGQLPCNLFPLPGRTYLLQTRHDDNMDYVGNTYLLDGQFRVLCQVLNNTALWHGARSIDRNGPVVIFGEYRLNKAIDFMQESVLYRSVDYGKTWKKVLICPPDVIRHFHTVIHDSYQPGQWWASSGDRPDQCRVWHSIDNGASWADVTSRNLPRSCPPQMKQFTGAMHRFTDVMVTKDHLLWGTDDWIGSYNEYEKMDNCNDISVGSRLIVSSKTSPLNLEIIDRIGNPIRSIIDIEKAYIVLTQAKTPEILPAQVWLLSKTVPAIATELFQVYHHHNNKSSFTHSRSSRRSINGRFFTYRRTSDIFDGGACILQWDIQF